MSAHFSPSMQKIIAFAFVIASTLISNVSSANSIKDAKPVAGTIVRVEEIDDFTVEVFLGDRLMLVDRDGPYITIHGVYEDSKNAFVLLSDGNHGTSCGATFRVIDVKRRGLITPDFGTCDDEPKSIRIVSDALEIVMMDRDLNEVQYRAAGGKYVETKRIIPFTPIGPTRVPDDDVAAFVDGKGIFDAIKLRVVVNQLSKIMGNEAFTASRKRIEGQIGSKFESHGDFVVASACEPHECGSLETAIAFDHFGHVWASWTEWGKQTTYYGNPPFDVRNALTPVSTP